MTDSERNDELLARARDLSTSISPQQDLWPGIEAAISKPRVSRWTPRFAQAAAVLLLIGASSGLTWLTTKDSPSGRMRNGYSLLTGKRTRKSFCGSPISTLSPSLAMISSSVMVSPLRGTSSSIVTAKGQRRR